MYSRRKNPTFLLDGGRIWSGSVAGTPAGSGAGSDARSDAGSVLEITNPEANPGGPKHTDPTDQDPDVDPDPQHGLSP
jgi:hypothetical protein